MYVLLPVNLLLNIVQYRVLLAPLWVSPVFYTRPGEHDEYISETQ